MASASSSTGYEPRSKLQFNGDSTSYKN